MAVANVGQVPLLSSQPSQNCLRNKQIEALKCMINLNTPNSKSSVAEPVWKILIYDKYGQDVISPLVSVKDLRNMSVTLYLSISSNREPVPDATAIYFIAPNEKNITQICRDLHSHLYDSYHFNFITPITRPLLEELAKSAVDSNTTSQVSKIYDQYLNFISIEEEFFITRHQDKTDISYYGMTLDGYVSLCLY
jgi:hypothetical protein